MSVSKTDDTEFGKWGGGYMLDYYKSSKNPNMEEIHEVPGLIENINIYDMKSSAIASGYAMVSNMELSDKTNFFKRVKVLGTSKQGSGHDSFLKGIIINFDITLNHALWLEFMRYHFQDIVTSQSKMHRLTSMDLSKQCTKYVHPMAINLLGSLIEEWNLCTDPDIKKRKWREIVDTCPIGLQLTARVTTNYLQLKSMYYQRRNHKMEEWVNLCKWMENLPYFKEIVLGN